MRYVSSKNLSAPLALVAFLIPSLLAAQATVDLQSIQNDKATPKNEGAVLPRKDFLSYGPVGAPALLLGPAERARALVRDGAIQLSLYDALAMAIENNLSVEVARYSLSIAGLDRVRASGGGSLRGLDYSVAEGPTGVGGPGSPLLNSAASSVTPTTPTVNDISALNVLNETNTTLSEQGAVPYAAGPPVPTLQPTLVGQTFYFQRANQGLPGDPLHFTAVNYSLTQGFGTGTQLEAGVNNAAQTLFGNQSNYNPFSQPDVSVTLSQPLLRSLGRNVNLRYLRIGAINQRISRLLFYQQLISTVYGVARLYWDLASLRENAAVQHQSLDAARKLFDDDKAQVDQGTLAPLELTRAQSLVTSSELDVIQAEGLVRQQEVILKSQLARNGSGDPLLVDLPIVTTDSITVPANDDLKAMNDLVADAMRARADVAQAALQVEGDQIAAKASRNAALPEIDLVANFQTRGASELPFEVIGTAGTAIINSPADLTTAATRTSRIYQAGLQLNLPLRNRVAQADAARDVLQLRQAEARTHLLANQVREQVESSVIALRTARSALNAAAESRQYQEQLVSAERDKFSVGASTNFLVVQQETYLAQARSTEVAARSVWIKARIALDRALGDLLVKNGITYDQAVAGEVPAIHQ
jgi:outer membrane protein